MDQNETIKKTSIPGLVTVLRPTLSDDRGFFREPARIKEIEEVTGIKFEILQMNHSRSIKNTLRGIHIAPWNKMIYVTRGKVQVVFADLREGSEAYKKTESFIIGDENKISVFVPKGVGNSYLVLSDEADYIYLTDEEWAPGREYGVAWNDPSLNISWQLDGEPLLSEKDKQNPNL
jgi:dTDP-4-dehydrorhamnose 3,5-epimerase